MNRTSRVPWLLAVGITAYSSTAIAQREMSSGSGFFISDTHVVTNLHVVDGCDRAIIVRGDRLSARILRTSDIADLAVLELDRPAVGVRPASLRTMVRLGEDILVAGYPLTGILSSDLIVTGGMVNALTGLRDASRVMQISAPVQLGSSGGPVLDRHGAVVGVVVGKLNASRVSSVTGDLPQNVNFAIKSSVLASFLRESGISFLNPTSAPRQESAEIAAQARSHTVKVECSPQNSGSSAPLNSESSAGTTSPAPIPIFADVGARLAYINWLRVTSVKMTKHQPNFLARKQFLQTLWYESRRAGLTPSLVLAMIEEQSTFRKFHVASNGSRGYMGIPPSWSRRIGDGNVAALFHEQTNLRFGCVMLRHMIERSHGDLQGAVVSYIAETTGVQPSRRIVKERVNRIWLAIEDWRVGEL